MNNHCKTKRLKITREKSWSTLTEESKQPIVQMLQYKSDNDNHKGGINKAVKKRYGTINSTTTSYFKDT